MAAVDNRHTSIVTRLLSIPHIRLDYSAWEGWTALHMACEKNFARGVALFGQDKRCSPGILNMKTTGEIYWDTALLFAVDMGHFGCVKEMDKLKGTNFNTRNLDGETLIDVARKRCKLARKDKR